MISQPQRVEFLRKIHLFRGLKEEELNMIAGCLEEQNVAPGTTIVRQGAIGDRFFLIYQGAVQVQRRQGRRKRDLGRLTTGDHFGADSLLKSQRRTATVIAEQETLLLSLSKEDFHDLIKKIHGLRARFEVVIASHRLTWRSRFRWLAKGEVIYFIARKHSIKLWQSMLGPLFALFLPMIAFILYPLTRTVMLLYLGGALLAGIILVIIWRIIDWGNDYYIVTNQRIVWLERVIGLYDSRQEAPLTAVLSVNSETDVSGRALGYGDVIVRTFVGKVVFESVGHPDEVVALVREHWERSRAVSQRANIEALKTAIREKLGLIPSQPPPSPQQPAAKTTRKVGLGRVLLTNLFKIRIEEKNSITYRKHWVVLIKQSWFPALLFLFFTGWLLHTLLRTSHGFGAFETVLLILSIGSLLGWVYQFVDWSNDIFQVTSDQILDIDKKPLGKVRKNVAPLDNILSMEARREGPLQLLFNYGNVYIVVGGSQMVFEDVMDPSVVQQDIDRRRMARRELQEQERAAIERDRLAEFFAMYHTNADELRREMESRKAQQEQGNQTPPSSSGEVK